MATKFINNRVSGPNFPSTNRILSISVWHARLCCGKEGTWQFIGLPAIANNVKMALSRYPDYKPHTLSTMSQTSLHH